MALFVACILGSSAAAQDSTRAGNPLARPAAGAGNASGNPLAQPAGAQGNPLARDEWAGTYSGSHALGNITIEVRRQGDAYAVIDRSSRPMEGTARLDADGALKGEYVVKLLGLTRRHQIELRREEGGLRYRTTGINTLLTKQ